MCLFFHDVLHLKKKDHVKQLELRFTALKEEDCSLQKKETTHRILSLTLIYCFRTKMKDSFMGHNRLSTTLKIFSLFQSVH